MLVPCLATTATDTEAPMFSTVSIHGLVWYKFIVVFEIHLHIHHFIPLLCNNSFHTISLFLPLNKIFYYFLI